MKTLLIGSIALMLLNSCKKDNIEPEVSSRFIESEKVKDIAKQTFNVAFELPAQIALTKVDQNKLTIVYTEKVNLIVDPTEHTTSWGLHLTENFGQTALTNFDFTTITQHGDKTFNWVDDNLNNVKLKAKKDTVINSKKYMKVMVERDFTFVKEYYDALAATNAQTALLMRKDDMIKYTSFYYSTNNNVAPANGSAKIQYSSVAVPAL
jgi:hypothetical protein